MRRNRIIWFCLWVLSLVGISFRGGAVSYGFFAALTLVPIISLLYLFAVYILFHIYQKVEQRYASVNEPVRYHFSLVNECPLLFCGIRVNYFSSFSSIVGLDSETEYELQPNTRIEKETNLICKYRGEYEVGIKEIEIQDFFRLFRIKYKNKECVHAVVKPQLLKIERLGEIELSDAARNSERNKSELDVLSREYVAGDDRRLINWSQYARTNTLMTRNQIGTDHREIAIIMGTYRYSTSQHVFIPTENKMLETALAVSYYFSRNNISAAEYHYHQELVRLSVGKTSEFEEFYDRLSEVSFSQMNTHGLLCEEILRRTEILESSMVFLVVSLWDSDMEKLLNVFEENGLHTIICFISDDRKSIPDLSRHNGTDLIYLTPHTDLMEVMG